LGASLGPGLSRITAATAERLAIPTFARDIPALLLTASR
jgi:hypothetical protein